jgi:hypothetical protein
MLLIFVFDRSVTVLTMELLVSNLHAYEMSDGSLYVDRVSKTFPRNPIQRFCTYFLYFNVCNNAALNFELSVAGEGICS